MDEILEKYAAITLLNGIVCSLQGKKKPNGTKWMPGELTVMEKITEDINELQDEISTNIVKDFLDGARLYQEQEAVEDSDE